MDTFWTLPIDSKGLANYNGLMAESALRRLKKARQNARWKAMTPAQRIARAAQIAATGKKLRAAALKTIGFSSGEIRRLESAARH